MQGPLPEEEEEAPPRVQRMAFWVCERLFVVAVGGRRVKRLWRGRRKSDG